MKTDRFKGRISSLRGFLQESRGLPSNMFRLVRSCALLFATCISYSTNLAPAQDQKRECFPDSTRRKPAIRAQSTLILVPVFVYPKYGLERMMTAEEKQCSEEDKSAFWALPADKPYSSINCLLRDREVMDLTADDFRLFQDGEAQKIELVTKEKWELAVRDNWTFHVETSITPNGIWSTPDLKTTFT